MRVVALLTLSVVAIALLLFVVVQGPFRSSLSAEGPRDYFDPATGYAEGGICHTRAEQCDFLRAVLGSLEDEWRPLIESGAVRAGAGTEVYFDTPTLVVFGGVIETPCGLYATEAGPFYYPTDRKFYIDPTWLDVLARDAPGDMGQALIVAHEYGHWIQDKIGARSYYRNVIARNPSRTSEMSIRYELQADCFAGVWGALARDTLAIDESDVGEALTVARHIGNDAVQTRAGGEVRPDVFTHGSSEQRARWFRRGFEGNGDPTVCAIFAIADPQSL